MKKRSLRNIMIIVDTSVWIEFLRNKDSNISNHLKQLLRSGKVAITGMILAEILQGIKNPGEAAAVKKSFESLPFIEIKKEVWQLAGETSASLRKKGITIPLSDIIIGVIAAGEKHEIFTLDSHFEKIPDVILHNPE
jgi:predicted nucleic acid-binding protein